MKHERDILIRLELGQITIDEAAELLKPKFRIDRMLAGAKAATAAVMTEADKINADWRALPENEKERRRMYWDGGVLSKKADRQFDRDRDIDERGITAEQAAADEYPRQSGTERV